MSDPRSNAEIEEVLTSVRKLVSTDDRPPRIGLDSARNAQLGRLVLTPADAVHQKPKDAPATSRLVLTPALRVADKPAEPATADPDVAAAAAELPPQPQVLDSVAALRAMTSGGSDAAETGSKPANVTALEAKIAELEAAIARQKGKPAPTDEAAPQTASENNATTADTPAGMDGEEAAKQPQDETVLAMNDRPEPPVFAHHADPVPEVVAEPANGTAEPAMENAGPESVEQRAQDVGLRLVPSTEQAEDEDEAEGEDDPWSAQPEPIEEVDEAEVSDAPEEDRSLLVGDKDQIDEEVLRALVTEIVHEELQGALGERITRNVRKLVRREIFRVLASQDLD